MCRTFYSVFDRAEAGSATPGEPSLCGRRKGLRETIMFNRTLAVILHQIDWVRRGAESVKFAGVQFKRISKAVPGQKPGVK